VFDLITGDKDSPSGLQRERFRNWVSEAYFHSHSITPGSWHAIWVH